MVTAFVFDRAFGACSEQVGRARIHGVNGRDCSIEEPGVRRVSLPDGRLLVIRRADAEDIDRLIDFYRSLPLEDRYYRFFTGGMPPRSHFENVLDPTRHGVALIVEVMEDSGATLVGDACYVPQRDGAGELAVTIAPEWRGWLGPYLLDT